MGYDMYGYAADSLAGSGDVDPLYFRLNIFGMSLMRQTLVELHVIDLDTPHPEFPPLPDDVQGDDIWTSDHPLAAAHREALKALLSTRGCDDKVPVWKFESNDGWVVTPEECGQIARALRDITHEQITRAVRQDQRWGTYYNADSVCGAAVAKLRTQNPELETLATKVLDDAIAHTDDATACTRLADSLLRLRSHPACKTGESRAFLVVFFWYPGRPSLPMSCETLMTTELMSPEGENGARDDVGVGARWGRWPRSGARR